MQNLQCSRYEMRAEQHLQMARKAVCATSRAAHLNLASHLATEAQSIRDCRDPVLRTGSWLKACEGTSDVSPVNAATDLSYIAGMARR